MSCTLDDQVLAPEEVGCASTTRAGRCNRCAGPPHPAPQAADGGLQLPYGSPGGPQHLGGAALPHCSGGLGGVPPLDGPAGRRSASAAPSTEYWLGCQCSTQACNKAEEAARHQEATAAVPVKRHGCGGLGTAKMCTAANKPARGAAAGEPGTCDRLRRLLPQHEEEVEDEGTAAAAAGSVNAVALNTLSSYLHQSASSSGVVLARGRCC